MNELEAKERAIEAFLAYEKHQKVIKILTLWNLGTNRTDIARQMDITRQAVSKVLNVYYPKVD